jgi:MoaA/NifB/PqqE/SkfB family radical SAM enzyme
MATQSLYHTYQRFKTLQTDTISVLPIVILMPHSACNCRCVMCDIWKDNKNLKQLTEKDITGLLGSLKHFGTKQVLMSGGEALLNANFFRLCEILRKHDISITLLSTGLLFRKNTLSLLDLVHDVIVSLDGDETTHDAIRDIPGAYSKLKEGVQYIKSIAPGYRITARTVIHKLNFRVWPYIIVSAKEIGLDQISFLPADVTSQAFNRDTPWDIPRQQEIMISKQELPELNSIMEELIEKYNAAFENHFIAESPEKIRKIHAYYSALHGLNPFPSKKCNAPWVSAVIEADGTVKPCFFHKSLGNIRSNSLDEILNSKEAIQFRKELDIQKDPTCMKCVCYLNLKPTIKIV